MTLPNLFLDLYFKSLFSFFSKTFQLGCSMSSSGIPNSSFRIFSTMLKAPCLFPSPQTVFHIVLILLCFAETNQSYWKIHRMQRWKGRGQAISTEVELITCMDNTFLWESSKIKEISWIKKLSCSTGKPQTTIQGARFSITFKFTLNSLMVPKPSNR